MSPNQRVQNNTSRQQMEEDTYDDDDQTQLLIQIANKNSLGLSDMS